MTTQVMTCTDDEMRAEPRDVLVRDWRDLNVRARRTTATRVCRADRSEDLTAFHDATAADGAGEALTHDVGNAT